MIDDRRGRRWDIDLRAGDDYELLLQVTDANTGLPLVVDAAAATIYRNRAIVDTFTVTVDPITGEITLRLSDTDTTSIGVGQFVWELRVTINGDTAQWLTGALVISAPGCPQVSPSSQSASLAVGDDISVVVTVPAGAQGPQGPQGPQGDPGAPGPAGIFIGPLPPIDLTILWADESDPGDMVVPPGGVTGEVLAKQSNSDYDTTWVDLDANYAPLAAALPQGGIAGESLVKQSGTDYDATWQALGLDDLSDVDLTGLGDDDILQYDQALGVFVPVPVPSSGISPTILDAKGDLIVATADNTPARLPVGADGLLLTANSAASTGVSWGPNWLSAREPQQIQANTFGVPGVYVTNSNTSTGAIGRNQIHIHPFVVVRPLTITKVAMRNIGAITGDTTMRCGIYGSGTNGKPTGNVLLSTDLFYANGTGAGTTIVNTVSLVLYPGIYWQAILYTGNADISWHAFTGPLSDGIGIPNFGVQAGVGNFVNFTFGALPNASSLPAPGTRSLWATFYDWTWL